MEKGRVPNSLKKYRRLAGLSQIEAAKLIGVSNSNCISRWEKGLGIPPGRLLLALGVAYETLPHHFYPEVMETFRQAQG